MNSDLILNLLGIAEQSMLGAVTRQGSSAKAVSGSFAGVLAAAVGANGSSRTVSDIVFSVGNEHGDLIAAINNAETMQERLGYAEQFRTRVMAALQAAGYSVSAGSGTDKIVVNGTTYDILSSLNTFGAQVTVQALTAGSGGGMTSTDGSTRSISEVLFSAESEHADLIEKINSAATLEERLNYARELREQIITDLRNAGHTAQGMESVDKIVIDGQMYDIFRGIKAVGEKTAVQMLWIGGAEGGSSSNPVVAILSTGVSLGTSLLSRINASDDIGERKSLAIELRQRIIDALQQAGFTAGEGEDADQLVVNGKTYDFIRRLYYPDETASIQAMLVA
jgi:hypothetical protein